VEDDAVTRIQTSACSFAGVGHSQSERERITVETLSHFLTPEEKAADRAIRHNDMYAKNLARQQQNLPCWFCNSTWGHYSHCVLITGGVHYSAEQKSVLRSMGLREDEGWGFRREDGLPSRHSTWVEFCIYTHEKRKT
jgi:hypothetical protein